MRISLTDMLDQNGNRIFTDDLIIEDPPLPEIKGDLRGPFYGDGSKSRIIDYKELLKKGFIVVEKRLPKFIKKRRGKKIIIRKIRLKFPGQKFYYKLKKLNKIKRGEYPKNNLPSGLLIRYNMKTRCVKLEGLAAISKWKLFQ